MKIQDMILVMENIKGRETNMLMTLQEYKEAYLFVSSLSREESAQLLKELFDTKLSGAGTGWAENYITANKSYYAKDAIGQLYGTKENNREWSDLYFAGNKSIHAAFCTGEAQLRGFLMGNFNDGEWSFDEGKCPKSCLGVLRIYNMRTDGHSLFPSLHYERVEHTFHAGEVLHNMNGNDYRVLAVLSPKNLLLMSAVDGQIIVGRGVNLFERYPKGEAACTDYERAGVRIMGKKYNIIYADPLSRIRDKGS